VLVTGVLAMAVQVALLRELSAAFYGVDLIYLLAIGGWLLWTAAGALVSRRTLEPPSVRVSLLLLGIGVVIPLDIALIRGLRILLGGVPGAYLPLPEQLLASALCLLPPAGLLGLLFQWTAKRYMSAPEMGSGTFSGRTKMGSGTISGPTLARAYAIESVGGLIGGGLATWTLVLGLQNVGLALGTAGLAFAAALQDRHRHVRMVALGLLAGCATAAWQAGTIDRWMTSWNHPDVVETADSPHGRVTVTERAGQISVYENDALAFESEGTAPEELAHLALIQHPAPRRVLLVGGVGAALVGHVLAHHPQRIDDIDINATLVSLLERRLPAPSRPEVRVRFDDPRRALARPGGPYDVLIVAAMEPSSAQANRFYTREFFAQCAGWLSGDGVLAFRLASAENLWTPQLTARTGSIYAALRAVFADVVVLPGGSNIVLASRRRLERDPGVLGARLNERQIRARLVSPRYVRYVYSNDRFAEIARTLDHYRGQANTDANGVSYQATSLIWLSKFVPSIGQTDVGWLADAFGWSRGSSWLALLAAFAGAVWCGRRRRRPAGAKPPGRTAVVFMAAFAGMAIDTLLLLEYQLKQGVVYRDLGLLLMSVMAGLAAGAWLVDRQQAGLKSCSATDSAGQAGVKSHSATDSAVAQASGRIRSVASQGFSPVMLLGLLALLALLVSVGIRTGVGMGPVPVALLLFVTGSLVAIVFGQAGAQGLKTPGLHEREQRRLVSPLYAADVFGGCVGSVLTSLVLIPLLGLPLTGEWVAALTGVAAAASHRGRE
jgi:spermidine synthase